MRGGMVSEEGKGAGNRALQRRYQCRSNRYTAFRAVDRCTSWMAVGVSDNWSSGFCVAHFVAAVLPQAGRTWVLHQRRKRVHTERSCRAHQQRKNKMAGGSC